GLLLSGALWDDRGPDCDRRCAGRRLCSLRCADRDLVSKGATARRPYRRGINDHGWFSLDPALLSRDRALWRAPRSQVCRWKQMMQADSAQSLEILGQVQIPKRNWLLPSQTEIS